MRRIAIEMPASLDAELASEVQKQAVYATRGARSFRWDDARRVLAVELEPSADEAVVEHKVSRLVASMVSRHRALPKKTLAANARKDRGPLLGDIEETLVSKGFLRNLGPGQVALSGPPLAFARALDGRLAAMARDRFGAREEAYPALIPADLLKRCGYVKSFPHALSMVTHLVEDIDALERFHKANVEATALTIPDVTALAHPSACLSPAVCYHFYPSLEGARLGAPLLAVTAVGRCFRYESKNFRGLERLWEFDMREVIFCGAEGRVSAAREDLIGAALAEATSLDLDLVLESANDPFFSAEYAQKSYWQSRNDLKFEMKLALPPGPDGAARSTAAASFNLHEDFFGRTFAFTAEGAAGFTGCAAWGIARWVLAAFAQHGLTPSRWPEAWRADVFG